MLAPAADGHVTIARSSQAAEGAFRLVPFPRAGDPRLLLPADHPRAAASAVRRYSEGGWAWTARAAQLAALGVSAGLLAEPPISGLTLAFGDGTGTEAPLLTHLSEILGEELTVAVRTGRYRPNGKPVLLLLSLDGRVLGFAKVGGNSLTKQLVRNEACALAGFDDDERRRLCFGVPRIIHHGPWHQFELLVVSALKGGRGSRRDPARPAMRQVAARSGLEYMPLGVSDFWADTQARLAALPTDDPSAAAVVAVERAVSDRLADERLLFGGWHGDWTPWNMASTGDRLVVWDWERSSASAPVGLDLAHHFIMVANHRRRLDGQTIGRLGRRAEPVISDLGQASRHGSLVILLALLEMAVRFEEARAAGIALTNRYTSLLTSALTFLGGSKLGSSMWEGTRHAG